MLHPNRKLNIVNSPNLAYNMNYNVAKKYFHSYKEKWQLSEDRSAEKRNEMHIHRQKRTEKRNEILLPYRDSEKENL